MRSYFRNRAPARRGMNLIELMVVIATIGILVALLLPAIQSARESARRAECHNNLRQLGLAMTLHEEHARVYPVGCIGCKFVPASDGSAPARQRFLAWNIQVLPYLDEASVWRSIDLSKASYEVPNKAPSATVINVFLCPSTLIDPRHTPDPLHQTTGLWQRAAFTDYGGIYGVEGIGHDTPDRSAAQLLAEQWLGVMLYEEPVAPREITDGLSKTACIAETVSRRQVESEWINGNNVFAQEAATPINGEAKLGNEIGSPHPGGASVAFCDGHVEFVSETIEQTVLNALLTKAGDDQ